MTLSETFINRLEASGFTRHQAIYIDLILANAEYEHKRIIQNNDKRESERNVCAECVGSDEPLTFEPLGY